MGNMGKAAICAGNCFMVYIFLENWDMNAEMISPFGPLLVVLIFTYNTADVFIGIFTIAADTFLHCFIMEEDLNQKDGEERRKLPENLEKFIEGNAKEEDSDDDDDSDDKKKKKKKSKKWNQKFNSNINILNK